MVLVEGSLLGAYRIRAWKELFAWKLDKCTESVSVTSIDIRISVNSHINIEMHPGYEDNIESFRRR